jgi:undecaprenyl phosphate-alpha-L-ara4N flippase subunit ArnE
VTSFLLVVTMALLAAGQIQQKRGAERYLGSAHGAQDWYRAFCSSEIVWAAVYLGLGLLTWLAVLYRTDVSRAFPILSFGSVIVLAASRLYLGEQVSARRWGGALLITVGVLLVSAS